MELDKIIEYIVQEVVKKINSQNIIEEFSPKEKILVAITGSTNNLEQIVLELRKISKNYDLSLVFSEAAKNIIDENVFSEFHIIKDFSIKNYDEILSKNDIILLPLLTKNTVAKLVVGIRDNAVTNLVSKALLLEKRVIAAYDSCIVNNEVPYAKLINSNVEKLKDYGLIFVQAKELADYMLNKKDLEINSLREKNVITAKILKIYTIKKLLFLKILL